MLDAGRAGAGLEVDDPHDRPRRCRRRPARCGRPTRAATPGRCRRRTRPRPGAAHRRCAGTRRAGAPSRPPCAAWPAPASRCRARARAQRRSSAADSSASRALRVLLRDRVQQRAEVLAAAGGRRPTRGLERPAQRAPLRGLDLGRARPARASSASHSGAVAGRCRRGRTTAPGPHRARRPPPAARACAPPRGRARRRRRAACSRCARSCGDEAAQVQRRGHARAPGLALVVGRVHQLEERGRLLVDVVHGRDQQRAAGARARDGERPQLVGQDRVPRGRRGLGVVGRRRAPRGPATTSTSACAPRSESRSRRSGHAPSCTPATTTRSHSRPAAPAGRQHLHGRATGAGRQGVRREVLRLEPVDERARRRARHAVHERLGGAEQRQHGVQVTVGPLARRTPGERGPAPRLGLLGRAPQRPQDGLRVGTRPRPRPAGPRRARGPAAPPGARAGSVGDLAGPERLDQQRVAGPAAALRPAPGRAAPAGPGAGRRCRGRRAASTPAAPRCAASRGSAPTHTRMASSSGRAAGSSRSGTSLPSTLTGTDAPVRARRSAVTWAPDRATTAICDHATPRSTCALRSACATNAASCAVLGSTATRTSPSPGRAGDRAPVLHGADRSDALRDPPDHRPQPGVVPPRRAQHDRARTELAGSRPPHACPPDQRRRRAAERLHGRVRVRQQQHARAVVGEHPQQPGGGRGALLVVVDDDQPPARAHRAGDLVLPGQQRLRGLVDDDRRVQPGAQVGGAGAQLHDVEVLLVQPRRAGPGGPAVRVGEGGEVHRGQATLGRAHEQVAQLVAEGAQAEHVGPDLGRPRERHPLAGGVPGEQVAEQQVLLGARDQRRGRLAQQGRARPEHRERRRRRGLHERPARRPAQPRGHPVPQVRRRTPARREDQHVLRGQSRPRPRRRPPRARPWSCRSPGRRARAPRDPCRGDRRSLLGIQLHEGTGTVAGDVRERRAHEAQGVRGAGHATIPSRATDTRRTTRARRPDRATGTARRSACRAPPCSSAAASAAPAARPRGTARAGARAGARPRG